MMKRWAAAGAALTAALVFASAADAKLLNREQVARVAERQLGATEDSSGKPASTALGRCRVYDTGRDGWGRWRDWVCDAEAVLPNEAEPVTDGQLCDASVEVWTSVARRTGTTGFGRSGRCLRYGPDEWADAPTVDAARAILHRRWVDRALRFPVRRG
jgi:hypothetical protein